MPLTDIKRAIFCVALFFYPVFAVVGISRAFLCNSLYRISTEGHFCIKKLGGGTDQISATLWHVVAHHDTPWHKKEVKMAQ